MPARRIRIRKPGRDLAGTITLESGVIRHASVSCGEWRLPIHEIRLIAEETDESGPWGEDWRIVFAASTSQVHASSISANGMWPVLDELSAEFGAQIIPALSASTRFASRILYPAGSVGLPVYRYFQQKTWYNWIWPAPVLTELTDHARQVLQSNTGV